MSHPGDGRPNDPIGRLSGSARPKATFSRPTVPDYELLQRMAAGAYGEVWLARSKATGVLRAAKIVWRDTFEEERPFQREFEGIQSFERISREHPSQLALYHIGRNDAQGYFYYVMELADAANAPTDGQQTNRDGAVMPLYRPRTLRVDLTKGRLRPERVVEIGQALAEALANLHSHGLVHRDVKPSNVIFVNGRAKLADIGLVTDAGETRSIVGTEGYLAPEGPGSPQADLFALGKVLYEAITGLDRRRFPRLPPDLRSWPEAELVLELNEIVIKACATKLEDRYRSAEEIRADLELLKAGRSVKRLRLVERRLSMLTRAAVVVGLCLVAAAAIFYETYRQQQIALRSLVRLHVTNGTHLLNEGDLFGALLSFTEALRLDAGDPRREEGHRIRIAAVLRQCPKLVGVFTHGTAPINDAAFSPDSTRVVTAGDDHIAECWALASGERQFSLMHTGPVFSVAYSPDGQRIATTSTDNRVHLWSARNGQPLDCQPILHRAWNNGPVPVFNADGTRLLTLKDLRTVTIWHALTGEPIGTPLRHPHAVSSFGFSPDGRQVLTVSEDRMARLWSASTGELVYSCSHERTVNCGDFSSGGTLLATGGDDDQARLWDLTAGGQILPSLIHRHCVDSVAFSPDGTRLATACRDKTVELWDLKTKQSLLRPLLHERRVLRTGFTPDGGWIVSSSEGNRIRFWDADSGELRGPPLVHDTPRRPAIFSADGHLVLTLRHDLSLEREEIAEVWDLAKREPAILEIRPVPSYRQSSRSPDGRFKALLSGDTIRTVEIGSGRAVAQALKQAVPFRQAYFSGDNTVLLTESIGDRGQLWDLSRGEPLTPMLKTTYSPTAEVPRKSELPRDKRSVQSLVLLAELLSGNRVDETGGFRPLEEGSFARTWNELRRASPEEFSDSPQENAAWHDQEARACEQAWNWWSARFHLRCLLSARPGDKNLEQRLAYTELALQKADRQASGYLARRSLNIPPRDPHADPATVDLSNFYNLSRRDGDNSMASLPSGLRQFAGTCFDVRGVVQLFDRAGDSGSDSRPSQVSGIPINRRCRKLHFLQATAGHAVERTEVSDYIVHYADHSTESITNIYGRDVRSWWTELGEPLKTDRSVLVWMGSNPQAQSDNGRSLRMYKTSWDNPHPDLQIITIDFVSAGKGVGPFLVAMTAE